MAAPQYRHADVVVDQMPKHPGAPCGDLISVERSLEGTLLLLCDGKGSGVQANLAAEFIASRIIQRFKKGDSVSEIMRSTVEWLNQNRSSGGLWGAFSCVHILPTGLAVCYAYDSPEPLLISGGYCYPVETRPVKRWEYLERAKIRLQPDDAVLLVSDGIAQAGLGQGIRSMPMGWTMKGVVREVNLHLQNGDTDLPRHLVNRAMKLWNDAGDDCSALLAKIRNGVMISVLTGPPSDQELDATVVQKLMAYAGFKAVCGASTARLVARETGQALALADEEPPAFSPPAYQLEGIDLATEGCVTLNQLYNILECEPEELEMNSPVSQLYEMLTLADRVTFMLGTTANPANEHISFRAQGILGRETIIPLIAARLQKMGKLVEIARY
jgi:hypothetical protein